MTLPDDLPPMDNATRVTGTTCTRILLAITADAEAGKVPPTVRELAARCGVSVGPVQAHLRHLKRLGLVTMQPGRARTLRPAARRVPYRGAR